MLRKVWLNNNNYNNISSTNENIPKIFDIHFEINDKSFYTTNSTHCIYYKDLIT